MTRRDHYQKMLDHAMEKFHNQRSTKRPREQILDTYKKFIKVENRRLRMLHDSGLAGYTVCRSRARLLDIVLQNLVTDALEQSGAEPSMGMPLTLVAVGGYGRGVLNPRSDVDLLFLTQISGLLLPADLSELISQIVVMLFDVGFQVGHSVRSIKECIYEANENNQTKTSLIEMRLLMGSKELFMQLQTDVWHQCFENRRTEFLNHRVDDLKSRHEKNETTPFVQEPNVKQGCGGLRDYQNLIWMSYLKFRKIDLHALVEADFMEEAEFREITKSYDFLLRVRNQMHYLENRAADILTLRLQGRVAKALGYNQRGILRQIEAFMRDYYLHTRNLFWRSQDLMRRWQIQAKTESKPGLISRIFTGRKRRPTSYLEDELMVRGGLLYPKSESLFKDEPVRLLRVFHHYQVAGADLSPELERLISKSYIHFSRPCRYSKAAREVFEAILSRRGEVAGALRRMHQTGILGRYLPEFGDLDCLVQHEFFHHFTADEHTLRCIDQLDNLLIEEATPQTEFYRDLFRSYTEPFILYLAFLMHDTGRASGLRPHEDASALLAMRVCRRWSLSTLQRAALLFLVNNHLVLFRYSSQKNIDDPVILSEFCDVVKTVENLDSLMLFTYADSKGTSPTAWTTWKEMSAQRLYKLARRYLSDPEGYATDVDSPRRELGTIVRTRLSESYELEIRAHLAYMPDHYFSLRRPEEVAEHIRLIRRYFRDVRSVEAGIAPPVLKWVQFEEAGVTELTIASWDRGMLLAKFAGILSAENINIVGADIYRREDNLILDVLRICDSAYRPITSESKIRRVENAVQKAFSNPDFQMSSVLKNLDSTKGFGEQTGRDISRKLDIIQDHKAGFTVVSLEAPDRFRLLYDIFQVIGSLHIEVCHARILTELGAAVDTFYLQDYAVGPVKSQAVLDELRQRLFTIVAR